MRALTVALLLAACGGGPSEDTPQGEASSPNVQQDATNPQGEDTVTMEDIAYAPKELTVNVGDTVTWVNQDTVEHDVVSQDDPKLKSQLFGKDGRFEYEATRAGTLRYVCTVHPGMEGTLVVEE